MEVKVFVWQGCFAIRCAWNSRLSKSALPISSGTARRSFPYVWRHVHFALEQPLSWTVSIATIEQWRLQSSAATPSKNDFVEDDWKHKHENRKASRFGLNLDTKRLLHCKQSNDNDLKPVKIETPPFQRTPSGPQALTGSLNLNFHHCHYYVLCMYPCMLYTFHVHVPIWVYEHVLLEVHVAIKLQFTFIMKMQLAHIFTIRLSCPPRYNSCLQTEIAIQASGSSRHSTCKNSPISLSVWPYALIQCENSWKIQRSYYHIRFFGADLIFFLV